MARRDTAARATCPLILRLYNKKAAFAANGVDNGFAALRGQVLCQRFVKRETRDAVKVAMTAGPLIVNEDRNVILPRQWDRFGLAGVSNQAKPCPQR